MSNPALSSPLAFLQLTSFRFGRQQEKIAAGLGISQSSLYRWQQEYRQYPGQAFPGSGQQKESDAEVARLKKELRQAQMENEILKKAAAIFTRNLR